uniref:Uncharacterized protein n=1 Tax=Arundo donax TaxID=35708 RepID=A0A0A9A8G1_ARUDO
MRSSEQADSRRRSSFSSSWCDPTTSRCGQTSGRSTTYWPDASGRSKPASSQG